MKAYLLSILTDKGLWSAIITAIISYLTHKGLILQDAQPKDGTRHFQFSPVEMLMVSTALVVTWPIRTAKRLLR